ncbi:MAG: ATP-dependent zinc metalloprotease FtsH [Candidatus Omnitrophica bacterium]|nr:ATP-dependent zinc metalloprotease FtsH [Candidatus Omnitrophota bacterium]
MLTVYLFQSAGLALQQRHKPMTYSELYRMLNDTSAQPHIAEATATDGELRIKLSDGARYLVNLPERDEELLKLLRERVATFDIQPPRLSLANIFFSLFPWIPILFLFWLMFRGAMGGGGRSILAFGKSRAKQVAADTVKITFNDVAGVDEAKEELQEIIEFLKDPKRFQRLGGKIPKGVLLMGPPGSGKTLLAKAVAGEAGVPFFSISGSDFVEMFVGVGASRVRDLFEQSKRSAKASGRGCIIFIDEIDAVGRQRFAGIGGGHDEREQTLNALLVEMDGFDTQEGVILMAATNRPDVLDPALLRPGRFDRQIVIDRPDLVGREAILKVHVRHLKLGKEVDLKSIARQTPGFSGADLANLANEAALLAARFGKEAVGQVEMEAAMERVVAGPERKSRVISENEKKVTAYHEAGHALLALLIPGADPLHKVSIIPRGTTALGYTLQLPLEDRYTMTRKELMARLTVMMGGRASEELTFHEMTTGAQNDIQVATEMARRMVCEFGMSERLGYLTFGQRENQVFLGRDIFEERNYSEKTAELIDEEIRKIIDTCYARATEELTGHQAQLERLAQALLEKEVLDGEEVKRLVGLHDRPTAHA